MYLQVCSTLFFLLGIAYYYCVNLFVIWNAFHSTEVLFGYQKAEARSEVLAVRLSVETFFFFNFFFSSQRHVLHVVIAIPFNWHICIRYFGIDSACYFLLFLLCKYSRAQLLWLQWLVLTCSFFSCFSWCEILSRVQSLSASWGTNWGPPWN